MAKAIVKKFLSKKEGSVLRATRAATKSPLRYLSSKATLLWERKLATGMGPAFGP